MLIFIPASYFFTGLPTTYRVYENGPQCEEIQLEAVSQANCASVAKSLGYSATLKVGSYSWAPAGCSVYSPQSTLHYNSHSGRANYNHRTFCKGNTVSLMMEPLHKMSSFLLQPNMCGTCLAEGAGGEIVSSGVPRNI